MKAATSARNATLGEAIAGEALCRQTGLLLRDTRRLVAAGGKATERDPRTITRHLRAK